MIPALRAGIQVLLHLPSGCHDFYPPFLSFNQKINENLIDDNYYVHANLHLHLSMTYFECVLTFFRPKDIGRAKAVVAAEFVNSRVAGCNVTPYPLNCLLLLKYLIIGN